MEWITNIFLLWCYGIFATQTPVSIFNLLYGKFWSIVINFIFRDVTWQFDLLSISALMLMIGDRPVAYFYLLFLLIALKNTAQHIRTLTISFVVLFLLFRYKKKTNLGSRRRNWTCIELGTWSGLSVRLNLTCNYSVRRSIRFGMQKYINFSPVI